ncbi:MAG: hypothetical protein K5931_07480, partial [Lachnospiraceae bacterium]|nr:hypothetical protein [Lachnospiraceae bacterium]
MNLISIEFFVFFILVVIIYFLLPGKLQWLWLLISSGFFYFKNANTDQCLVFLAILAVNYLGTMLLSKTEENKQKLVFNILLILDVLCLVCFKYSAFLIAIINKLLSLFGTALPIDFVVYFDSLAWDFAPPKISYFMLIIIGYVVDVYWGRVEALKNPGKFALLASYFPLMTSGPIIEYENVGDSLLGGSKHRFSYE